MPVRPRFPAGKPPWKQGGFFYGVTMTPHVYPRQCAFKSIEDIKGKKVTIMGLGLNGGGEAAVRFFLNKSAYVTVTDMKPKSS